MGTFSFAGYRIVYNYADVNGSSEGEAIAFRSTTMTISVPSSSTFSYRFEGYDDDYFVSDVSLSSDISQLILGDGDYLLTNQDLGGQHPGCGQDTLNSTFGQVTLPTGTSTFLSITTPRLTQSGQIDYIFVIAGNSFPNISSLQDWLALEQSITSVSAATGDLAPGAAIAWDDLNYDSVTQEDDFSGTPDADLMVGGAGEDYFHSSEGDDTYRGRGSPYDQITFNADPSGVIASLRAGIATDGWGDSDSLGGIERLRGSAYADQLTGNMSNNVIWGLAGDDTLNGARGKRDEVRYDLDANYGGTDGVVVNLKRGFAIDGFGDRDDLSGFEDMRGSERGDKLTGSNGRNQIEGLAGNDVITGLGGNDTLSGYAGNDRLIGGNGNDLLYGGYGSDIFVFKGNFGHDRIGDFDTSGRVEKIDLSGIDEISSFRDLVNNHITEDGEHLEIADGDGNTITMRYFSISDLSANDFIF